MAIETRHQKSCAKGADKTRRCNCDPSYRAVSYNGEAGRKIKVFPTKAAALAWLRSSDSAKRSRVRATDVPTLGEAFTEMAAGMRDGSVLTLKRLRYKPSPIYQLEGSYTRYLKEPLGNRRLDRITTREIQDVLDGLVRRPLAPGTVANALKPLSTVYRRAVRNGTVDHNPTLEVEIESPRGKRERVATPEEVSLLIAALPKDLRVLYGLAAYAGLRRGECLALRWDDIDRGAGIIHVERSFDVTYRQIGETKSRRVRNVPLLANLSKLLLEEGFQETGQVCPKTAASSISERAIRWWTKAGLNPITLHELRHTFASICIAAGLDIKQLATYMGHANVSTTLNVYGHLLPNSEVEAAKKLDAFLAA